jgi:hypothetical protein
VNSLAQATVVAALLLGGCGPDPVQIPTPPMQSEIAAVLAAYESPTGTIDTANIEATLSAAEARLEELQLDWLPELISEMLGRLDQRLNDSGLTDDPDVTFDDDRPIIDAVATVNHICRGWQDPPGPPDPAANGTLDFTAVVQDGRLSRAAWATASNCHARVLSVGQMALDGFLDGSIVLYLQGPLSADESTARFLFYMNGTVGVAGRMTSGSFDFLITDGHIEFRLQQPDGDVVVSVGVTTLAIHDRNAVYTCDLIARTCTQSG